MSPCRPGRGVSGPSGRACGQKSPQKAEIPPKWGERTSHRPFWPRSSQNPAPLPPRAGPPPRGTARVCEAGKGAEQHPRLWGFWGAKGGSWGVCGAGALRDVRVMHRCVGPGCSVTSERSILARCRGGIRGPPPFPFPPYFSLPFPLVPSFPLAPLLFSLDPNLFFSSPPSLFP